MSTINWNVERLVKWCGRSATRYAHVPAEGELLVTDGFALAVIRKPDPLRRCLLAVAASDARETAAEKLNVTKLIVEATHAARVLEAWTPHNGVTLAPVVVPGGAVRAIQVGLLSALGAAGPWQLPDMRGLRATSGLAAASPLVLQPNDARKGPRSEAFIVMPLNVPELDTILRGLLKDLSSAVGTEATQ